MPTPLLMAPYIFRTSYSPGILAAIQANGRLTFEDDLRSGGLLYFCTQQTSVCTELANSMGNRGVTSCQKMATLPAGYILQRKVLSASSSAVGNWLFVYSKTGWMMVDLFMRLK